MCSVILWFLNKGPTGIFFYLFSSSFYIIKFPFNCVRIFFLSFTAKFCFINRDNPFIQLTAHPNYSGLARVCCIFFDVVSYSFPSTCNFQLPLHVTTSCVIIESSSNLFLMFSLLKHSCLFAFNTVRKLNPFNNFGIKILNCRKTLKNLFRAQHM
jgi:hypothetical protein